MRILTPPLSILLLAYAVHAQHIKVIQPPKHADSSYYDIVKIDDNEFWAAGENGMLVSLDSSGHSTPVNYPSLGADMLKIAGLSQDEWLMVGKKGTLYFFNRTTNQWRVRQVPGYQQKVSYEVAIVDAQTIRIAGGMSKIADSKTTLPRGFIIRSTDNGATWEKMYSHPLAMIWDIDKVGDSLVVVRYNPFSKNRLLYSANGQKWHAVRSPHSGRCHQLHAATGMLAGGAQLNMNGPALLAHAAGIRYHRDAPFW